MGSKLVPVDQARERMAEALKESKRRFDAQNKRVGKLTFAAEARFALQAMANNPALYKCDPETLKDAMTHLAAMRCRHAVDPTWPIRVKFLLEGEEEIGPDPLPDLNIY